MINISQQQTGSLVSKFMGFGFVFLILIKNYQFQKLIRSKKETEASIEKVKGYPLSELCISCTEITRDQICETYFVFFTYTFMILLSFSQGYPLFDSWLFFLVARLVECTFQK